MVNPYQWEAYCCFLGMTRERWNSTEKKFVRRYLVRGWPSWSLERRAMAKQGFRQAAEDNAAKGLPGWR